MTTTHDLAYRRTAAIPRSRGAVTGLLLVALGAWGALVPFLGPAFHFGYAPDTTWHMSTVHVVLELLPGAVAVLAGLISLRAGNRFTAMLGGWLAVAAGAWFVVGPLVWPTFRSDFPAPLGSTTRVFVEQATLFFGLGALIVFLGAFLLGRVSVVSLRDIEAAEKRAAKKDERDAPVVERETVPARAEDEHRVVELPRDESPAGAVAEREVPADEVASTRRT